MSQDSLSSEKVNFFEKFYNCDRMTPSILFSVGTWHHIKKFGKERVHREASFRSVHLMNAVFARQNSGKDHMKRLCTKKDAPAEQHGMWRIFLQPQEFGQSYALYSYRSKGDAGTYFTRTRGEKIRCRFGSINAHEEQKIKLRRDGHSEKVQNLCCGTHCQWRSAHPTKKYKFSFTIQTHS